ncbi:MAG TPA: amino acid adenylation domain-containing protein [Blastocatellia bacterium]|nr:amino acid adenylation domain-containing protein [Blastocatellia bacterium]
MTEVFAFPTSLAQQRLWFLCEMEPASAAYNIALAVRTTGLLSVAALDAVMSEIVRRQDSFRTTFANIDGQPVQVVHPGVEPPLSLIDLSWMPSSSREAAALEIINRQAAMAFDIGRGPLFRVVLIRLDRENHITALVMHHIVSDGWSMSVLISEIVSLYGAFVIGKPSSLEELPIQYCDFSLWQRQWLAGGRIEKELEYWRKQLAGIQPVELPSDRPHQESQDYAGAVESLQLEPNLTAGLRQVCRREGVTLFMLALVTFKLLLSRHAGQTDIAVGTPIANRNPSQVEGLVGFFVNTLVLRSNVDPDVRMRDLIQREKKVCFDGYAHQNVPFEKLVEELHPERDLSRNPLFDVMFNFLNIPDLTLELPGLSVSPMPVYETESKFPLTLYARELGDALLFTARYRKSLFSRDAIATLLAQLRFLLQQVAADTARPAGSYSLVSPEARGMLPDPRLRLDEPYYEPVPVTVSRVAAEAPGRPAIARGDQCWSYGQLARKANELAVHLIAGGIERGHVVAVFGPRTFGLISSMMAVTMSGGVLLTLDPALPARRLQLILSLAGAKQVLYVGALREADKWLIEPDGWTVTFVDPETGSPHERIEQSGRTPLPEISPDDRCYIFFTSGTTGQPRAVVGCHKGLSHFLAWQRSCFSIGPQDRCAMLTALSFDVVMRDVFLPLTSGATLCLPDEEDLSRPDRITVWLERERISALHTVPALAQAWLSEAAPEVSLRNLNRVFFAGEPLRDSLVLRWRQTFPESGDIINLYGPTETTLAKCFYMVPRDCPAGIQPVGRAIPYTQALVLSRSRDLCGVGEMGEIVIRTPFRTLGYLNDPEANKVRFLVNHFRDDLNDLLYFTGDSGRYRADGSLQILGRLDNQIKIRGVRVEPEEVAAVLSQNALVQSCVVAARTDAQGASSLVAYVVPLQKEKRMVLELSGYAARRLPSAMIPSAFVFLDRLPLTARGKVDMSALPAPDQAVSKEDSEYLSPRTPIEEVLAAIWEDLLGVARVSINDDFFELGGHSLLATRVVSRVNKASGLSLPVRSVFERPSIAGLASEVQALALDERQLNLPAIRPALYGSRIPLSFAQQRLWVLDRLYPESHAYNIPSAFRLAGPLDVEALRSSLAEVIRRHEILRTRFSRDHQGPVQVVQATGDFDLPIAGLQGVPEDEKELERNSLTAADAKRPFDLERGPLLRATLLSLALQEHILLITMHHIISDGWSRTILAREILQLYRAFRAGAPSPLPEPAIQYGDFAIWQRDLLQGNTIEHLLGYWRRRLNGAPVEVALPLDHRRPARLRHSGRITSAILDRSLSDRLARLSRQNWASLFMTMLTGLEILLFRWTGQSDMVVGTVIANRHRLETEGSLGCFINFLPVRSTLSEVDIGTERLKQTRATLLEAYSYQDCPFDLMVDDLNPARRQNVNPIYNVAFILQNVPRLGEAGDLDSLRITNQSVDLQTSLLDLRFVAWEIAGEVTLLCEYNSELFEPETIDSLLHGYASTLRKLADQPEAAISEYELPERLVEKSRRSAAARQRQTIAIASTFTAEPVKDSLGFWTQKLGLECDIVFAPFNQVLQQLLDPSSLVSLNRNGINVLLIRFEDWRATEGEPRSAWLTSSEIRPVFEEYVDELAHAIRLSADRAGAPIIIVLCPASSGLMAQNDHEEFLRDMEEILKKDLEAIGGVHLITSRELISKYPVVDYYDRRSDELGRVPYTSQFFTALGTVIARRLTAIDRAPYKVVALDCDHTLWDGVCGEDGPDGVRINAPYRRLQEFMIAQHDAGLVLCLCSKNDERDVLDVFERHSDMALKLDHIIARRINWSPKAENLKSLAKELGFGLDSFIFIDDDPVECAAVRAACPQALTLQLPTRREHIPRFLDHVWAFDHVKLSEEDRRRNALYRQARERDESQRQAPTLEEFLAGLQLQVDISSLEPADLDRASQLTYRTNQFNMTGRKRSSRDLRLLQASGRYECYIVRMSDRFGDYGLVGLLIFEETGQAIEVDTFLLSCRALGRTAEQRILDWLLRLANERGVAAVALPYVTSAANHPALAFLNSAGAQFRRRGDDGFLFTFPAGYAVEAETAPEQALTMKS